MLFKVLPNLATFKKSLYFSNIAQILQEICCSKVLHIFGQQFKRFPILFTEKKNLRNVVLRQSLSVEVDCTEWEENGEEEN